MDSSSSNDSSNNRSTSNDDRHSSAGREWGAEMESADGFIPRVGSSAYTQKSYWEFRFAREQSNYEWLSSYEGFAPHIRRCVPRNARVLLVGCGNSNLTTDLAADGYTDLTSTDYSDAVIERMRDQTASTHPAGIVWAVADMTSLSSTLPGSSFDAIIDKAAMDALLADGGDVWDPPQHLLELATRVMTEYAAVLKPGGVLLQVSFSQPHFRRMYLLPQEVLRESAPAFEGFAQHPIATGFGYFCYELHKRR